MDLRQLIPPNEKRINVELIFKAVVTDLNVPTRIPLLLIKSLLIILINMDYNKLFFN